MSQNIEKLNDKVAQAHLGGGEKRIVRIYSPNGYYCYST